MYSRKVINHRSLKIVYFAVLLDGPQSGAAKKVNEQIKFWGSIGVETELFVITNSSGKKIWADSEQVRVFIDASGIRKLFLRNRIMKTIFKSNPDLVYIRDSFPFPLPKNKSQAKLFLEVQSNVQAEVFKRSKLKGIISIVLDTLFLRKIDAFVFVAKELSATRRFESHIRTRENLIIPNGIDLSQFEVLPIPPVNHRLGLFFIGQDGQPWHGSDQIYELAQHMQDYDFHIVGLMKPLGECSANVFHHGVLSQEDYLPIAAKCVVGIGSLNLMSLNMSEASPLKTRHYLAMGLPVISRYTDSDFGKQVPFILSLPAGHELISTYAAEIREFCNIWSGKRVAREDIQVIDVHSKETNRIEFLRAIAVGNS